MQWTTSQASSVLAVRLALDQSLPPFRRGGSVSERFFKLGTHYDSALTKHTPQSKWDFRPAATYARGSGR
ncbi:MAG: hypothetical protein EXQ52_14695 [Bryobacterales bacterium]|nr:hypothetical protein [Bryobacterales bacterium]